MTNQTPQYSGPGWPAPPRRGLWSRLTPLQRVGAIAVALLLPFCGGVALIGALGDDPEPAGGTGNPVAEQLAGDPQATTPAATAPAEDLAPAQDAPASGDAAPATEATTKPVVTKKVVTVRKAIPYDTRTVEDDSLAEGKKKTRTKGVAGVKTLSYIVTMSGGRETGRKLAGTVVTKRPVTKVVAVGTKTEPSGGNCDPNYTPCVPVASDVDCAGGSGNGPAYVDGPITVTGDDHYDLDRDGDGIACD